MAKYNEILTGRHNRFVQKLFGMKGAAPTSQLSGDVQMVHPFFHGAENRLLESWSLWGASKVIAANAANVDTWQLRMPSGTNVIAVIEKLTVASSNANIEVLVGTKAQASDLAVTQISFTRDTRQLATTGSTAIASSTNVTVTGPNSFYDSGAPAGGVTVEVIVYEDQQIVISPGFCLQVQSLTANVGMTVNCWWRERALEESEVFK
jgi:hypothetical protein